MIFFSFMSILLCAVGDFQGIIAIAFVFYNCYKNYTIGNRWLYYIYVLPDTNRWLYIHVLPDTSTYMYFVRGLFTLRFGL